MNILLKIHVYIIESNIRIAWWIGIEASMLLKISCCRFASIKTEPQANQLILLLLQVPVAVATLIGCCCCVVI